MLDLYFQVITTESVSGDPTQQQVTFVIVDRGLVMPAENVVATLGRLPTTELNSILKAEVRMHYFMRYSKRVF